MKEKKRFYTEVIIFFISLVLLLNCGCLSKPKPRQEQTVPIIEAIASDIPEQGLPITGETTSQTSDILTMNPETGELEKKTVKTTTTSRVETTEMEQVIKTSQKIVETITAVETGEIRLKSEESIETIETVNATHPLSKTTTNTSKKTVTRFKNGKIVGQTTSSHSNSSTRTTQITTLRD